MKGTQCNAEKFVVFTNVALFLDWINSVLLCMTPICGNNRCEIEAISGRPECMGMNCIFFNLIFEYFLMNCNSSTKIRQLSGR